MTYSLDTLNNNIVLSDVHRPDENEALAAGAMFKNGISDLFLNRIDDVIQTGHESGNPFYADIRSFVEADDGSSLLIIAREYGEDFAEDNPAGRPSKCVYLTEIKPSGSNGKVVVYSMAKSNRVVTRRIATEDSEASTLLRKQLDPTLDFGNATEADIAEYFRLSASRAAENLVNFKLEIEMGVNEQPVGIDEISGLLSILNTATTLGQADWDLYLMNMQKNTDTVAVNSDVHVDDYTRKLKRAAAWIVHLLKPNN